jgi:glycosyltransferase involved in cell wall biosynthesis
MLLIDSLYINNSGGLVLLNYLIDELEKTGVEVMYLIDNRNPTDYSHIDKAKIFRLKASLLNRNKFYNQWQATFSKVLCFGNIPPPFKLSVGSVHTYLHQFFYLDSSTSKKGWISTLKFWLKKKYFNSLLGNTKSFWVQSHHMAELLATRVKKNTNIEVLPFYKIDGFTESSNKKSKDFVYISNANPHKNHQILLDAWQLVNASEPETTLHLTVSKKMYPELSRKIDGLSFKNVINHGLIPKEEVRELLSENKYMVYPSLAESFGLVLIESAEAKSVILAPDLPYVYSVIEPSITFDPCSAESIADAMLLALEGSYTETVLKTDNKIDQLVSLLT